MSHSEGRRAKSKKVLITGGTGFIGSHLAEFLLEAGYSVTCLVRDTASLKWLSGLPVGLVAGDCSRPETLMNAVLNASFVVHAAGLTKARRTRDYYNVNYFGTRNILEACARHNPDLEKFILISSQAAAGPSNDGRPVRESDTPRPVSDYGKSKLLAEKETLGFKDAFPVVTLRPSAVYGPRDRDMFELFLWATRGVTLELTGPERTLNVCYVGDLARAIAAVLERPVASGGIYFVAEEKPYSWAAFREALLATGGVKAAALRIPYAAAYLIGVASEAASLLTRKPSITSRQKVKEAAQPHWVCDAAAIGRDFGFRAAYPLRRGLDITWKWYRDNNWLS